MPGTARRIETKMASAGQRETRATLQRTQCNVPQEQPPASVIGQGTWHESKNSTAQRDCGQHRQEQRRDQSSRRWQWSAHVHIGKHEQVSRNSRPGACRRLESLRQTGPQVRQRSNPGNPQMRTFIRRKTDGERPARLAAVMFVVAVIDWGTMAVRRLANRLGQRFRRAGTRFRPGIQAAECPIAVQAQVHIPRSPSQKLTCYECQNECGP